MCYSRVCTCVWSIAKYEINIDLCSLMSHFRFVSVVAWRKFITFALSLHTWWNFNWFSYNVEYKNRNKTSLCWKEYTDLEIPLVFGIYKNNKVLNIISGVEF